jgi:hypothetical protein
MGTEVGLIEEGHKVIHSYILNRYVEQRWGKVYSCAKGADAGQNTFLQYDIDVPTMEEDELWFNTEMSLDDHKEAMANWQDYKTSPDPGVILNELVMLGQIPAGNYIVLVSW